jgi:tetratricopeptide (TPR) repeat protein
LINTNPDDKNAMRLHRRVLMTKLDVLVKLKDIKAIQELLTTLIASRKRAYQESQNDLRLQRDYANILLRAGNVNLDAGNFDTSIDQYETALSAFKSLVESNPENGRAPRDLEWGYYLLGEVYIANDQHTVGLEHLESSLARIKDRCIAFHMDAYARSDLPKYPGAYMNKCGETDQEDRSKKQCSIVLLHLQPVIEGNPENYALGEKYKQIREWHDHIGQVVALEK